MNDGPVKTVNTEIGVLIQKAERAEHQADLWGLAASAFDELYVQRRHDRERARRGSSAATESLEQVRADVAAALIEQAQKALNDWQKIDAAQGRPSGVGWFGSRRAAAEHRSAQTLAQTARQRLVATWGEPPRWHEDTSLWIERVTRARVDADPRVTAATARRVDAARELHAALEMGPWLKLQTYANIFGSQVVDRHLDAYLNARPHEIARDQTRTAARARAEAELLKALTPTEAAERIAQNRMTEKTRQESARRPATPAQLPRPGTGREGPALGR